MLSGPVFEILLRIADGAIRNGWTGCFIGFALVPLRL